MNPSGCLWNTSAWLEYKLCLFCNTQVERAPSGRAASEAVQTETRAGSGKRTFVPHHQRGTEERGRRVSCDGSTDGALQNISSCCNRDYNILLGFSRGKKLCCILEHEYVLSCPESILGGPSSLLHFQLNIFLVVYHLCKTTIFAIWLQLRQIRPTNIN